MTHLSCVYDGLESFVSVLRFSDLQDHAVAGLGAGTVATLVMHPLDLIKVRFQLADSPRAASFSTSPTSTAAGEISQAKKPGFGRAVYGALADAVRADGWKGLYRGLVPNLVGGAGSWGLYFLLWVKVRWSDHVRLTV